MKENNKSIHVNINKRCNSNCIFCMECNSKNLYLPSSKKMYQLFRKGRKKTDSILFTGPEPTVNKSLLQYVKIAQGLGYKEIRLITNGRLLSYFSYAQKLLESGTTNISISLHGSNEKINDSLTRTPGGFRQTLKACQNLITLKPLFPLKIFINCTLTKINANDLFDFLKMVISFNNFDGIIINAMIPQGRGYTYFDSLIKNYSDLSYHFKSAINKLKNIYTDQQIARYNINISGLPLCLLRGYEKFFNEYERILMNLGRKKVDVRLKRRTLRLKCPSCKPCAYYLVCEGI